MEHQQDVKDELPALIRSTAGEGVLEGEVAATVARVDTLITKVLGSSNVPKAGKDVTGGDGLDDNRPYPQERVDAVTKACIEALKSAPEGSQE